jgi:hypothetical protein
MLAYCLFLLIITAVVKYSAQSCQSITIVQNCVNQLAILISFTVGLFTCSIFLQGRAQRYTQDVLQRALPLLGFWIATISVLAICDFNSAVNVFRDSYQIGINDTGLDLGFSTKVLTGFAFAIALWIGGKYGRKRKVVTAAIALTLPLLVFGLCAAIGTTGMCIE